MIFSDQMEALEHDSKKVGTQGENIDFALLVDGLAAEREQGITIDVAYRFFTTDKRKFIVADTPGHEQYTRNMVTGASNADVAVLLVDAQSGVSEQTRRHATIVSMMGIKEVIVTINKMDLIGYDQDQFAKIRNDFATLSDWIKIPKITCIPVAAVHGHNVVTRNTAELAWYDGPTLLEALENAEKKQEADGSTQSARVCVQRVSRPNERFRGFQGTVYGAPLRVGQAVLVQPSSQPANIDRIVTFDGDLDTAEPGQAVTIVLDRKLDVARGDFLVDAAHPLISSHTVQAKIVVLWDQGLQASKRYIVKSSARTQKASLSALKTISLGSGEWLSNPTLGVNDITQAELSFDEPFFFDVFEAQPETGAFILIDPDNLQTVAGGMVEGSSNGYTNEAAMIDLISLRLPADLAKQVLETAHKEDRLDEVHMASEQFETLDASWIKELTIKGLSRNL